MNLKVRKAMTGRQIILDRINKNKPEGKAHPGSFQSKTKAKTSEELLIAFKESLAKAGAEIREFDSKEELGVHISSDLEKAINLTDQQVKETYQTQLKSKAELEKTEVLIIEGQFGVAENGAIWVIEEDTGIRLLPFVTQQLVLVLDKKQLVSTMHEAYQKTNLTDTGFGVFISGPSKTADIEQSLVYGAHGAKELVVALY